MAKRALCIGINDYPGTQHDLRGCVNDANDWAATLSARGFTVSKLLDSQATKAALVAGFNTLITSAKSGDSIAITFSGHGTLAPDTSGDETDGYDEALCPFDIHLGNVLLDDEIHQLFAKRPAGVRLLLISDSCHSGTVTRNAPADPDTADAPRIRFLPLASWLPADQLPKGPSGRPLARLPVNQVFTPWAGVVTAAGDVLMAGCEEGPDHYSYDATFNNRSNGAFTHYALKALKTLPATATYRDWHAAIRRSLPSTNYPQKPQLVGTKSTLSSPILA
ncbi:MAG: caspase family protein [Cyanobacteria bacterium K_Offshore_surface_m2_239]|nr:caspase family protein [Cyanobacteria bacterium K_Offshore_surface_m2_239]